MKTGKIVLRLFFFCVAGIFLPYSCQKDNTTPVVTPPSQTLTSKQTIQVENSDAQDAISDKAEEDVASKLDELQSNNYAVSSMKSYLSGLTDTIVISVDHPDTTYFPKVVTLTYYSFQDSSAFEDVTKNGQLIVTVNRPDVSHPRLLSWVINFKNFALTTDSTTVTINGIRTVNRQKASVKFNGIQSLRLSVTDNITAATRWAVVSTGKTDTLKFTRNVNKVRTAITHFRNVAYFPNDLIHIRYRHVFSSDTVTYNGTVTGINEAGNTYTKTITSPLDVTEYKGSLVVSSGTLTYVTGTDSYQITFEMDPEHKHFTLVTITNNLTGKTSSFDRRFGRIFRRWW
jgi:hypothetical protein